MANVLKLHWGDPKHLTEIRSWTGATGFKKDGVQQPYQHRFVSHEVARWYGVSFGREWFVGFSRFGRSLDYRTDVPPRLGFGAEVGTGLSIPFTIPAGENEALGDSS